MSRHKDASRSAGPDPTRHPEDQPRQKPAPTPEARAAEVLHGQLELLDAIENRTGALAAYIERADTPAEFRTFEFTQASPVNRVDVGRVAASLGLIVPAITTIGAAPAISLGFGGNPPTQGSLAPRCLPGHFLILPVSSEDLQVGIDPAAAALMNVADRVWCHLLRFCSVQPFSAGAL